MTKPQLQHDLPPPQPMSAYPTESGAVRLPICEVHAVKQKKIATQMPCVQYQTDSRKLANAISLPEQHETSMWPEHRMLVASNQKMNRLTENNHSVLLKQLTKHAAAWKVIGTHLGFTQGQLDNIEAKPLLQSGAPTSWLSRMLAEWLQWAPGDIRGSTSFATLESLKYALNEAGFGATAHDLGEFMPFFCQ